MLIRRTDELDFLAELALGAGHYADDPDTPELRKRQHPRQRKLSELRARMKCGCAGRRFGKSHMVVYWLCEGWRMRPGQLSAYIARTLGHAREILWETLKALNREWKWGATPNEGRLELVFPNGYKVKLYGAENAKEAEKLRGPHYWRVAVDEMHLIPDELAKLLCNSILRPALSDLRGEMLLLGTPGYVLSGYWFQRSLDAEEMPEEARKPENQGKQWPTIRGDMRDNPFIPHAEQEMDEVVRELYGGNRNHPEFIREWLGRWVRDDNVLVYPFDPTRNTYLEGDFDEALWAPGASELKSVIGVDIGFSDGCGFAVSQKRTDSPIIRTPRAYSEVGLELHDIAKHIKDLKREYRTHWVYVDASEPTIIASLRNFGIACEKGIAGPKRPRIEYVRSLLLSGFLKAHPVGACDLIGEMQTLPWELDDDGKSKGIHREGWVDECCDAELLSVLPLTQQWQEKANDIPPEGTEEHAQWLTRKRMAEQKAKNAPRRGKRRRR